MGSGIFLSHNRIIGAIWWSVHRKLCIAMIDPERVREAMSQRGFSQAALARAADVSPAAIQQILNGSTKRSRSLTSIARALDVSAEWLEGVDTPKTVTLPTNMDITDYDLVSVQRLFWDHREVIEAAKKRRDRVFVSRSWLRHMTRRDDPSRTVFVMVGVDSMSPTIQVGDEIAVYVSEEFDESTDGIWIMVYRGNSLLRRLKPVSDTEIEVFADNPNTPPFIVGRDALHISGRVVWHARSMAP